MGWRWKIFIMMIIPKNFENIWESQILDFQGPAIFWWGVGKSRIVWRLGCILYVYNSQYTVDTLGHSWVVYCMYTLGMVNGSCVVIQEGQEKPLWRPKSPWNKPGTNRPFQKGEIAPHSHGRTCWYGGSIMRSIALSGHPRGIQGHEQTQNDNILFNDFNDLVFQFRPKSL